MTMKEWTRTTARLLVLTALVACQGEAGRAKPVRGAPRTTVAASKGADIADIAGVAMDVARGGEQQIATAPDLLEGWRQMQREAVRRRVRELSARNDADSLLDAALLLPLVCYGLDDCAATMAERARLLAAAARLAPEHPLIAFLQVETCMAAGNCPAAYRRLIAADADNLYAYLGSLQAASQASDPVQLDRALQAAAAAPLYDPYVATLVAELESALQHLPPPSPAVRVQIAEAAGLRGPLDVDGARLLDALGISLAMGFPSLQGLLHTCSVDGVRQVPARRAPCLTVLARMADSDTSLARSVGLSRLVELTAGTTEGARWRERLREFAWVQERFLEFQSPMHLEDLRMQVERGEWAAMRALLRRHAIPLQPAADWLPSQARYRQLLAAAG